MPMMGVVHEKCSFLHKLFTFTTCFNLITFIDHPNMGMVNCRNDTTFSTKSKAVSCN